ncbi:translesion DNA synthesis-associated protein ImuA [Xylophilus sp. GW821-FHT01B05]
MPALAPATPALPDPLASVWRADQLGSAQAGVVATGFDALDAVLPGGGWPLGSLTEILQARPGQHVWQLLLPALAQQLRQAPGPVVLVAPPWRPFMPYLQGQGLPASRLLLVRPERGAGALWAGEQALRCADVCAVLAWLPHARSAELRRLQLAAQQQGRLLFVFRDASAERDASPARLRLQVAGTDTLRVQVLKRRGPPVDAELRLPAHPAALAALLTARRARAAPAPAAVLPFPSTRRASLRTVANRHALDRTAALG